MKYSLRSLLLITGAIAVILGAWVNRHAVAWRMHTLIFSGVLIVTATLLQTFLYWSARRLRQSDEEAS